MRFLILGANGMAGHLISTYLVEKKYDITTLTREPYEVGKNIILDVRHFNKLKQLIHQEFDVIVNAIGLLNQHAEECVTDAILLNSYLPQFIAHEIQGLRTKFIHLSTDCVFSGVAGGYTETSIKDGLGYYALTKNLGEVSGDNVLTIRTSIIGPDLNPIGIGLFNWFMKQRTSIKGYDKAIWTGVTTLILAKAIEVFSHTNINGIYHLVNGHSITKYELLTLFNKLFKDNSLEILRDTSYVSNKSLVCMRDDACFTVPCYEEMLVSMKEWIQRHADLYPHYKL